jgi:PadR family transcriptional regulator PadR
MDDARELIRGNTPTMVLAVLQDASRHGYAIAREVNRRTGHALKFKQGTLYPVLHALERDGLIIGAWEHPEGERPRKVYTITPTGRAELERRLKVWRTFAEAMQRVVEGTPHGQPA